jgi:NAD-reducing hydrogenase large subunit
VGACEAPRGTLFHHYRIDEGGLVTWANLLVASGQNAAAMDRAVRQVAARWVDGPRIGEALRQRVSAAIRAFDPCLSCATHAVGDAFSELRLVGPSGELLDLVGG